MHPSVYREFLVSLTPDTESREIATGVTQDEVVHYVKLMHVATGEDIVFKLAGHAAQPERFIEGQVMKRFPATAAAAELRALYGRAYKRLKDNWKLSFGDRVYKGLEQCESKGGVFWHALLPSLPPVLYSAMCNRAIIRLEHLPRTVELREVIQSVHGGWLAVLNDARRIRMRMTGLQRLTLDVGGWNTDLLNDLSMLEFGQLREKAHFARLALNYLVDADWSTMLNPILDDLPPAVSGEVTSNHLFKETA